MLGGPGPYGVSAPRILIVDDDPNLLVILADQLRADGYDVADARDGDEALRRLRQSWPDLLVIDMLMPRMDGLTLAREVKSLADLPIIVLSAIDVATPRPTSSKRSPRTTSRSRTTTRSCGRGSPACSGGWATRCRARAWCSARTCRSTSTSARRPSAASPSQLTPTESRLLYALAANLGQTVTTETLLARGWADTDDADPSYVWVTMRRLRQKVEVDPNKPVHLHHGARRRLPARAHAPASRPRSLTRTPEPPPTGRRRAGAIGRRHRPRSAARARRSARQLRTAATLRPPSRLGLSFRARLTARAPRRGRPAARRLRHRRAPGHRLRQADVDRVGRDPAVRGRRRGRVRRAARVPRSRRTSPRRSGRSPRRRARLGGRPDTPARAARATTSSARLAESHNRLAATSSVGTASCAGSSSPWSRSRSHERPGGDRDPSADATPAPRSG